MAKRNRPISIETELDARIQRVADVRFGGNRSATITFFAELGLAAIERDPSLVERKLSEAAKAKAAGRVKIGRGGKPRQAAARA